MSSKVKSILSALVIVLSVSVVIAVAFSNPELGNAWDTISRLDLKWIAGLLLCWAAYAVFEAVGTWSYLRSQGYKIHLPRVIGVALIGLYYSNITPSAAGGQPMQINSLRKAGIPVGYGTTAVTIRFVCNQFMICMISLGLLIFHRDFVYSQLGDAIWAARVGWAFNFLAVPMVLLAAFKRSWIQKLSEKLIALLAKMHLVRDPETMTAKATEVLDTYHTALINLIHSPGQILLQIQDVVPRGGFFLLSAHQHILRAVHPDHVIASVCKKLRERPGAAPKIQHQPGSDSMLLQSLADKLRPAFIVYIVHEFVIDL